MKVCLDSRLIKPGGYFVPVRGELHNGHRFIEDAINNGAEGIIEEDELYDRVKEKITKTNIKIVGITGSHGKTTATHLTVQLLSKKYSVALGRQNTKLGLAADFINNVDENTQVFIAEIGMDRLGEISEIVELFPLDIAVVLTINHTHLEKLETFENIVKAKFEILEGLKKKNPVLILNKDNNATTEFVKNNPRKLKDIKIVWFGESSNSDVTLKNTDLTNLKLLGKHNTLNTLAVVAVVKKLGMGPKEIQEGLADFTLPNGRLKLIEGINGSILIDDTYNANPISTTSALDVLNNYHKGSGGNRKIAVLGSMLELGEDEIPGHIEVAKKAGEMGVGVLVTVGKLAKVIYDNAQIETKYKLDKSSDFPQIMEKLNIEGDVILLKGSQGIRNEKITEMLMADKSQAPKILVRQDIRWKESV